MTTLAEPGSFKDTSTSLVVFGVLEIILGALCALLVPLVILGQLMASRTQHTADTLPVEQLVASLAIYILLAIFFVAVGYGSIRGRRWARALMLIVSWLWLLGGIVGVAVVCFMMPAIFEAGAASSNQQGHPPSPEMMTMIRLFAVGFSSVIYVIIPGTFVIYYMSKNVKATCEWKDPTPRWTDRCPLPVLGLSLIMGYGAIMGPLSVVAYHGVFPFFGVLLSGIPGSMVTLISCGIWGFLAWGLYKLKPSAWLATIIVGGIYLISSVTTFLRVDLIEFYRQIGTPEKSIEMIKKLGFFSSANMVGLMIVSSLVYFGYLVFIKKYFPKAVAHGPSV